MLLFFSLSCKALNFVFHTLEMFPFYHGMNGHVNHFYFFFFVLHKVLQTENNSCSCRSPILLLQPLRPCSTLPARTAIPTCDAEQNLQTDVYWLFPFLPRSPSAGGCRLQAGALSKGRNKRVRSGWQVCENVQQLPAGFSRPAALCTRQHFASFQLLEKNEHRQKRHYFVTTFTPLDIGHPWFFSHLFHDVF